MNVFEVFDKYNKKIRLTKNRLDHIAQEHPEVTDLCEIQLTVEQPTISKQSTYDPRYVIWYYRFNKKKNKYCFVAVKHLNGDGFIITTFYTRTTQ